MPVLTLAPLSTPGAVSAAAQAAIRGASRLFLQTDAHPSANWIREAGLPYQSMDDLYAASEDFDVLSAAVAQRLMGNGDAVYAFPGGRVGAAQLQAILRAAEEAGMEVQLLPGSGYVDAALALCPDLDADACFCCCATALPASLDPALPLCITELDTVLRAGEVKLALSEFYPDSHTVRLCVMDAAGRYSLRSLPLYALDRQADACFAATVLIVPPLPLLSRTRHGVDDLCAVMKRLRAPGGCPWDAEQTHESLRKSLLEESYEVLDALDAQDPEALCEELGDLLLQIVFHAQIEEEKRAFTLRDVTSGIVSKLIYRHPHVFADTRVQNADEVLVNWEQLKKKEKHMSTQAEAIDAVPRALPALMRAAKVQKKAADVGFDWEDALPALQKVYEEADEVRQAMAEAGTHLDEELGDLLFACVNAVRLLGRDAELTLRAATDKFADRFARMESLMLSENRTFCEMTLPEMDTFWERVKNMD